MKKKILITGGAGFIGHHVIEHILKNTDWDIISLDRLNISGNYNRLQDLECWEANKHRVKLLVHDLRCSINDWLINQIGIVDYILHMAASTHVDRSISNPMEFVLDNVVATTNMLNFARKIKPSLFMYFSTDEVFGPAPEGVAYKEWDRYNSGNPYAAAKAGGEEMCLAFANTYGIPTIITHTMNVFGERQHPEKFIPLCIKKILAGEEIIIHANKEKTKAGSRFWIHGRNVAAALLFLINKYETFGSNLLNKYNAEKFNIVGEREVDNLQMAQFIYDEVKRLTMKDGEPYYNQVPHQMVDFHSSRPGHDLRYALDGAKLESMGWKLPVDFEQSLANVIKWSLENNNWL